MVVQDRTKRQLFSAILLLLAILGLCFELAGMQALFIATALLMKNKPWGSAFDVFVAMITLIYPALGVIGVIIAYVEYVITVTNS